jgi:acyl carrier protein
VERDGEVHRQVYVVDRAMNLLPRGVVGELFVRVDPGDRSERTAEAFVDDPFQPGRLVRRSGHLARWSRDLELELLGQVADQGARSAPIDPGGTRSEEDGSAEPRTRTEQSVAAIFSEVLSLPRVGADESFFDVGGNSLQAMRAVSRINKGFGIKLSVRTLYGNVTVRAVSAVVDEKVGGEPA